MSIDPTPELERFQHFLGERLEQGEDLSPEEALDLWRQKNPSAEDYEETVSALREALADMDAGDRGVPWEQFDRDFRKRFGLA